MNFGVKYRDRFVGEWFQACLITERWWVQCLILFTNLVGFSTLRKRTACREARFGVLLL